MLPIGRWLLGLGLALLNCGLSSVGLIMQRRAALTRQQDAGPKLSWIVGVSLYVIAAVPDVIAYTLVPQVVCSTIACFRLVVVTVLAHIFLDEKLQLRETFGMLACSLGTLLCLTFGPRPDGQPLISGQFYHAEVVAYLTIGLMLLVLLLLLEHTEDLQWSNWWGGVNSLRRAHFVTLPVATGLAYGLEKVFNTEMGFIQPPRGLPAGFVKEPQWAGMVAAIGLLGLTDFYLNLRAAQRMPVQVFVPAAFALSTALLYFQSVAIFGEFRKMTASHAAVSICGACLSLLGALCIQPPQLGLLGREQILEKEDTVVSVRGAEIQLGAIYL